MESANICSGTWAACKCYSLGIKWVGLTDRQSHLLESHVSGYYNIATQTAIRVGAKFKKKNKVSPIRCSGMKNTKDTRDIW